MKIRSHQDDGNPSRVMPRLLGTPDLDPKHRPEGPESGAAYLVGAVCTLPNTRKVCMNAIFKLHPTKDS